MPPEVQPSCERTKEESLVSLFAYCIFFFIINASLTFLAREASAAFNIPVVIAFTGAFLTAVLFIWRNKRAPSSRERKILAIGCALFPVVAAFILGMLGEFIQSAAFIPMYLWVAIIITLQLFYYFFFLFIFGTLSKLLVKNLFQIQEVEKK